MNKYIIPICDISKSKVYNQIIFANSHKDCQNKLITKFADYSDSDIWAQFINDLDEKDILIGEIRDIEEL